MVYLSEVACFYSPPDCVGRQQALHVLNQSVCKVSAPQQDRANTRYIHLRRVYYILPGVSYPQPNPVWTPSHLWPPPFFAGQTTIKHAAADFSPPALQVISNSMPSPPPALRPFSKAPPLPASTPELPPGSSPQHSMPAQPCICSQGPAAATGGV